nr:NADH dehydrogenase subunit 2 [Limnophyes sp. YF-2022]
MFKNSYKFLFFLTMMLGTLITISSTSWFSMWMGLEINLLSFIPLMMDKKNLFSSEASLKYFLTQALASSIFLFSILMFTLFNNLSIYNNMNEYFNLLISSTMLMKMGSAPFHFWFPSVTEGLNWNSILLLMTWQKIAPLMIFSYCMNFYYLIIIVFFSMVFGSLGGLNQTSLRKLMAFSSINHLGWMIMSMLNNEILWMVYFLFYSFLSFGIIFMFNNFKLLNINQTFYMKNLNLILKISIFIVLLSLGGLPPFLGFFPKWLVIETLTSQKMIFTLLFMLFFTLITLFFYLRISYNALLMNHNEMNWNFKLFYSKKTTKAMIFMTFISLFGLILINFLYFFI